MKPLNLVFTALVCALLLAACAPKEAPRVVLPNTGADASEVSADEWAEDEAYSLPVVKFSAEKWRSPIGAYYFSHCTAVWAEMGAWAGYSVGAEAIS